MADNLLINTISIESNFFYELFLRTLLDKHVGNSDIEYRNVVEAAAHHKSIEDKPKPAVHGVLFDRHHLAMREQEPAKEIAIYQS